MITCHICKSQKVTHYRQKRRDGVWVVTARCENDHIPEKGKPFYSIAQFNIGSLPVLGERQDEDKQPELFTEDPEPNTTSFLQWFEQKEQRKNKLLPRIK
jgi:hypothetical protein